MKRLLRQDLIYALSVCLSWLKRRKLLLTGVCVCDCGQRARKARVSATERSRSADDEGTGSSLSLRPRASACAMNMRCAVPEEQRRRWQTAHYMHDATAAAATRADHIWPDHEVFDTNSSSPTLPLTPSRPRVRVHLRQVGLENGVDFTSYKPFLGTLRNLYPISRKMEELCRNILDS